MTTMPTNQQVEENENLVSINLIEEFMNITDDESKIISGLKEEFSDLKFFNYGALVYLQEDYDITNNNNPNLNFPHISELLQNYEKVFSANYFWGTFVLRLTKCNIYLIFSLCYL